MPENAVLQRAEIMLSQAKRLERDARQMKQNAAALIDDLQPKEAQGNGRTTDTSKAEA